MKLTFGDCVFDAAAHELRRGGQPVPLTPKAFELLALLVERRPVAVSKAEIRDRLWPKTFISDVNLAALAFEVRAAIGDDARQPRYLRTVRAFGYAFTDDCVGVGAAPSRPARFRLVLGDREIDLPDGEHVVGRGEEASIVLDRARVSRLHARIRIQGDGASIEDLGSKNGTVHQGVRLAAPVALKDGDEIRIGSERMVFRASGREAPTATAERPSE
jgi:DNA-binding winged helix-turn-helix (wHTH) protein